MIFFIAVLVLWPILILMPTKVINKQNFPKRKEKKGFVVSANHYSNFDVILFDLKFKRKIYYLAKKELFTHKLFGWLLKKLGAIKIDRQAETDVSAFKNSLKVLKENKPLGVFPEGTRNKTADTANMLEAKSGAVVFASKAGVPIIPIAIYRRPKLFRINKILVGEPFYPAGENPKKLTKEEIDLNTQTLVDIINNLHAQLIDRYSKKRKIK